VVALAVGCAVAWLVWLLAGPQREAGPQAQPLTATGYVYPGRLAPGRSVPVTAEVFNPNYFTVSVSSARVTEVVPDGSCAPAAVVFTARRRLASTLDPWTTKTLPVGTLTLTRTAPEPCAQAGFHLALTFTTRAR
jgi:hypothetical protein